MRQYIESERLAGQVRILPTVFNQESVCIVTSRQIEADKLTKLNAAHSILVKSGELGKIQTKYRVK
jgi:hypothetical protein